MEKQFYSNGKLLLSGEYAVLDGALSLAVPTKYGQYLNIKTIAGSKLIWKSLNENGEIWFEHAFNLEIFKDPLTIDKSNVENDTATTLIRILKEAKKMNPTFLSNTNGLEVETKLTFPTDWGLGSSSTLINNIAQWAKVDAYKLLWNAFSGSGYDIACAQHNTPITYQLDHKKPKVQEIIFDPPFKDKLFFVYLNKKQNSREGISQYRKQNFDTKQLVTNISKITEDIVNCIDLKTFEKLISVHEAMLSEALKARTVKEFLFSDYPGCIKSLGAWGGDFILATGGQEAMHYFKSKGYSTVLSYDSMVK